MVWIRKREAFGNTVGWPDYTGAFCGQRLEIEVKAPGGKMSLRQCKMLQKLHYQGCFTACVNDVNHLSYLFVRHFAPLWFKDAFAMRYDDNSVGLALQAMLPQSFSHYAAMLMVKSQKNSNKVLDTALSFLYSRNYLH